LRLPSSQRVRISRGQVTVNDERGPRIIVPLSDSRMVTPLIEALRESGETGAALRVFDAARKFARGGGNPAPDTPDTACGQTP